MNKTQISALFLDIGGVLLTNGWDRQARTLAADKFGLDASEMNERHHLTYDTYEEGKLDLDAYLQRLVFYQDRSFTMEDFKTFMFQYSQPLPEMLAFIKEIKANNHLKVVAISNEGRELTQYRVQKFRLDEIFDAFVSSCFVHLRKPDEDIYRLALDISQTSPEKAVYLDDRMMFIEVASGLGMHAILHRDVSSTRAEFARLGLL